MGLTNDPSMGSVSRWAPKYGWVNGRSIGDHGWLGREGLRMQVGAV